MMELHPKPPNLWLSLGANVGDAEATIIEALHRIDALERTRLTDVSRLYRSSPVGYTEQPPFLNLAAGVSTDLTPEEFAAATRSIESSLGRQERPQWHEREIDIDLLIYAGATRSGHELQLPHPRMLDRPFVIYPLAEIAPDLLHPGIRQTIAEICEGLRPERGEWIEVVHPDGWFSTRSATNNAECEND